MKFNPKKALKHLKDSRLSVHKRVEYALQELEGFEAELRKKERKPWDIWICIKCDVTTICTCNPPCKKVFCDHCGKPMLNEGE